MDSLDFSYRCIRGNVIDDHHGRTHGPASPTDRPRPRPSQAVVRRSATATATVTGLDQVVHAQRSGEETHQNRFPPGRTVPDVLLQQAKVEGARRDQVGKIVGPSGRPTDQRRLDTQNHRPITNNRHGRRGRGRQFKSKTTTYVVTATFENRLVHTDGRFCNNRLEDVHQTIIVYLPSSSPQHATSRAREKLKKKKQKKQNERERERKKTQFLYV